MTNAPTTRETADHIGEVNEKVAADHAELAACPFCGGEASVHDGMGEFWVRCDDCDASGSMRSREDRAVRDWNRRDPLAAILSEIAALRGEREGLEVEFRRQCGATADQMDLSERATRELDAVSGAIGTVRFMDPPDGGDVPLSEQVRRMSSALTQAERQRDELRKALDYARYHVLQSPCSDKQACLDQIDQAIANQGADQ